MQSVAHATVFKLIFNRLAVGVGYYVWVCVSIILFFLLLVLTMYFVGPYECPIRRALGFPLSRTPPENVATAIYAGPWEQDCQATVVKP
jgi:hypothetical protein